METYLSSDSDREDSTFDADMEALRRACMLTGADHAEVDGDKLYSDSDHDSDSKPGSSGNDDLGILRRLQERFALPSAPMDAAPVINPLTALRPEELDDEDDDLETLRAIQKRFTQYESDSLRWKPEKNPDEPGLFSDGDFSGPKRPNVFPELPTEDGHDYIESNVSHHEACNSSVRNLMNSKFPKSAQNFVNALKKNRSCQKFIRRKLIEIEAKIEKNKELKERVKCLMDFQVACKRKVTNTICQKKDPRVILVSVKKPMPEKYSKATTKRAPAMCLSPAENSHVSDYKMVLERFPVSLIKQPWSDIEKENLKKGIKQQYQEMLILNSMNMESDTEAFTDPNPTSAVTPSNLELTPEKIRPFIPSVNWNRLASMYLTGRSGAECEARWLNCEDPIINHDPWTAMEDKKLLFIIQERGIYNWIDISVTLCTQRTPFQCLVRYQRSLNPHILNKDWTQEEDARLCEAVQNYGDNNWQIVASCVEGRTGTQCSNRWKKTLNPERKRVGRWSVDEDKRLKVAVMLFGAKNWIKIARCTPGRTQVQCRERWLNCLDPALNLKPWSAEEDAMLLNAIAIHGNCWSKIAACIPPRTDNQCRRRWKILFPEEVIMLQSVAQIKKAALVSNFVDRESERPAIGPNDFIPLTSATIGNIGTAKVRNKKLSDHQPKRPRTKPRRITENLNGEVNSCTDLVPAELALLPIEASNSAGGLGASTSNKKMLSDHQPKRPRTKPRRITENLNREVNSCTDLVPAELALLPIEASNSAGGLGASTSNKKRLRDNSTTKLRVKSTSLQDNTTEDIAPAVNEAVRITTGIGTMDKDKALSDNQQNSRIISRLPTVRNSTADNIANSSVDKAPDNLPLQLDTASRRNNEVKRKKMRDNMLDKPVVESRCSFQENLTTDMLISSADIVSPDGFSRPVLSDVGNNIINKTCMKSRDSRLMNDNQEQMTKAEAEGSMKETFAVQNDVEASAAPLPVHINLLQAATDSTAIENVHNPSKKVKRKHQSREIPCNTLAGGGGESLLVSVKASSAGTCHNVRRRNTGSSIVKSGRPGANYQRKNSLGTSKMQSDEISRAMYGGGDDDDLPLSTFYNKVKRKLHCIVMEKNTRDVDVVIAEDCNGGDGNVGEDSTLAMFYEKAKGKEPMVTEKNTQAAADSSKRGVMHGGDSEEDGLLLLSTFYMRANGNGNI